MAMTDHKLQDLARNFRYPATPDIGSAVRQRLVAESKLETSRPLALGRLAWTGIVLLLILGSLLAVPQVRAAVIEFFQIGSVRIFPSEVPVPTEPAISYSSSRDLGTETTLDEAAVRLGQPVPLPAYPSDLGRPDHLFVQPFNDSTVILVWLEPENQEQVRLLLHLLKLPDGLFADKLQVATAELTAVNGHQAYWVEGAHTLQFYDSEGRPQPNMSRLVLNNVLIWQEGAITYRLESKFSMAEAIRIAASLATNGAH